MPFDLVVISPPQDGVRRQLGAIVADDGLWLAVRDQQPITAIHTCPKCQTLYQVINGERGPETVVACRSCKAPFPGRDGEFVLKYFVARKPVRIENIRHTSLDREAVEVRKIASVSY